MNINDITFSDVSNDTRTLKKGGVFVCTHGSGVDRHTLAKLADKTASYIVCERYLDVKTPQIIVPDANSAFAYLSAKLYDNPSEKFNLIGITGTNGKTTTTYLLKSIIEEAGHKVGLIGTNCVYIGSVKLPTQNTTPDAKTLQGLFAKMAENKCDTVIMEVSSHALALGRVDYTDFNIAGFTNLTQDHMDFHKDMQDYFEAKKRLFGMSKTSVFNVDDEWGVKLFDEYHGSTVSVNNFTNIDLQPNKTSFEYKGKKITCKAVGRFNLQNIALAIGLAEKDGISLDNIIAGLKKFKPVSGRMEILDTHTPYTVIIDYAHTPDGIEKVLKTSREFTKGRLISLFGCGGDRDKTKRPIMGKLASELSDLAVVTSDNPRTEDPITIINEILTGVGENKKVIIDRREAIKWALNNAKPDDVLVLCGKGHEDYQIIGTTKYHFDEHEIVKELLS